MLWPNRRAPVHPELVGAGQTTTGEFRHGPGERVGCREAAAGSLRRTTP